MPTLPSKRQIIGLIAVLAFICAVTWFLDHRQPAPEPFFTRTPPNDPIPPRQEFLTEHLATRKELVELLETGLDEQEAVARFGHNEPLVLPDGDRLYIYSYPPEVIKQLSGQSPQNYSIGVVLVFSQGRLVSAYEGRQITRNRFLAGESLLRQLRRGDSPETVVAVLGEPFAMRREDDQTVFIYSYRPDISDDFPQEYDNAELDIAFQDGCLVRSQYSFRSKDADADTDDSGNPSIFATGTLQTCLLHHEDSDGTPHWEESSPTLLFK
ncbi:MAG: hypothetical protein J5654_04630 [Victivallales bacterium]|nr:hypothetical protein [Victivallales bacterium]